MQNLLTYDAILHLNEEEEKRRPVSQYSLKKLLVRAVQEGALEIVKVLLDMGADPHTNVNIVEKSGFTGRDEVIHLAASMGDDEMVQLFISRGVKIDQIGSNGTTPLFAAVKRGQLDFAKRLIDLGANINAREKKYGSTVLIEACYHANTLSEKMFVKYLVDKGANAKINDKDGYSPLYVACISFYTGLNKFNLKELEYIEHIEALIEAGCDINGQTMEGKTPLATCIDGTLTWKYTERLRAAQSGMEPEEAMVLPKRLIELGAKWDTENQFNALILRKIISSRRKKMLALLINSGLIGLKEIMEQFVDASKAIEFFEDDLSLLPQDVQQKLGRVSKVKNLFNK